MSVRARDPKREEPRAIKIPTRYVLWILMVVYSVSSLTVSFADLSQLSSGCRVDLDYLKAVMGSARLSYEFLVLYEIESTVETDVLKIQN